jgi:hypothetical protein
VCVCVCARADFCGCSVDFMYLFYACFSCNSVLVLSCVLMRYDHALVVWRFFCALQV